MYQEIKGLYKSGPDLHEILGKYFFWGATEFATSFDFRKKPYIKYISWMIYTYYTDVNTFIFRVEHSCLSV